MNQQVKTGLGTAVILIFAVTAGVFVWYAQKNFKTVRSVPTQVNDQIKKNPGQTGTNAANEVGIIYTNSDYGFQLTLPKGWEKYTTSIMFGPENATQISFELPTNDAEWLKNNGGKKTASVFNLTVYPISSSSTLTIPGRKEISKNDKYVTYYDRIDKISDYPKDFTAELFSQADEIIKTFKWSNAVDTSNWQTYRNEKYGFELKYPAIISLSDIETRKNIEYNAVQKRVDFKVDTNSSVVIYVWNKNIAPSYDSKDLENYDKVVIDGHNALKGRDYGNAYFIETYIYDDSYTYQIEYSGENSQSNIDLYNQILSTFKFID